MVKNLPSMQETQETWVQSLGRGYPLEEEMATHLPGKSHGGSSLAGCSSWGCKESDTTGQAHRNIAPPLQHIIQYNFFIGLSITLIRKRLEGKSVDYDAEILSII